MKTGQGFLLVFSITSTSSLSELSELREQIIRIKDDENVPIVIVGNKSDLEEERKVSRAKAFGVSQSWGNAPYYETSARRRGKFCFPPFKMPEVGLSATANVDEVFIDLCRQIIRKDNTAAPSMDEELMQGLSHRRDRTRHRHRSRRKKDSRCTIL